MKKYGKPMLGILSLSCMLLVACEDNNNSNFPKEYVGFEKNILTYSFDKHKETEELTVKIIAADKADADREVTISGAVQPGKKPVFSIADKKVVLPAHKKSAHVRIKIYPKEIKSKSNFRLYCTPQNKEVKVSQLMVQLNPK